MWAGLPFGMLFALVALLSAVNWAYESKLIRLRTGSPDWFQIHLGPLLLATAVVLTLLAGGILFMTRILGPDSKTEWYMFVPLLLTALCFIFPALFIVVLGPAMISIFDSMNQVPG